MTEEKGGKDRRKKGGDDRRKKAGMTRLPGWFKVKIEAGPHYRRIQSLVREKRLHTICEEARCPQQMGMLE